MILVVFGNAPFPFVRLAKKIDELAGNLPEEIQVQNGHTDFAFRNARSEKFITHSEMKQRMERATLLISHGGCGTIHEALALGKKVIAVPRLEGEHNHSQRELVEALEKEGYLLAVYDIADLENKINAAGEFSPKPLPTGNAARIIDDFIRTQFPVLKNQ